MDPVLDKDETAIWVKCEYANEVLEWVWIMKMPELAVVKLNAYHVWSGEASRALKAYLFSCHSCVREHKESI